VTGAWVLGGALVLTAVLAVVYRASAGRFRHAAPAGQDLRPLLPTAGERATLVQFSSAFCAPCRATRVVLAEVAGVVPGVVHVEVDAEAHLDLVRRLDVRKTPTTLVLDRDGREVLRASGQPTRNAVLVALGQAVP
jgi:thiol-disulfide isomerase/thioredoxin